LHDNKLQLFKQKSKQVEKLKLKYDLDEGSKQMQER
jgi:hypothetical protein